MLKFPWISGEIPKVESISASLTFWYVNSPARDEFDRTEKRIGTLQNCKLWCRHCHFIANLLDDFCKFQKRVEVVQAQLSAHTAWSAESADQELKMSTLYFAIQYHPYSMEQNKVSAGFSHQCHWSINIQYILLSVIINNIPYL